MAETVRQSKRLQGFRPRRGVPPAVAHATRWGVAVAAAIWIAKAPGLVENSATWILITVAVLLQPTMGSSLLKSVARLAGTLAGALTAIPLYGLFAQDPPLLIAGFFLVQVIGAYGNTGRLFPHAWFVWTFTTAVILIGAMAQEADVETVAFQRSSMVAIGILLVLLVESLLWPTRAEPRLRQSLAARARNLGAALGHAIARPVTPEEAEAPAAASATEPLDAQLALVDAARSELGAERAGVERLARIAVLLELVASLSREIESNPDSKDVRDEGERAHASALTALSNEIAASFQRIADALVASGDSIDESPALDESMLVLDRERQRRSQRAGWILERERHDSLLRDLVAIIHSIEEAISSRQAPQRGTSTVSQLRVRPDPFRVRIALRTGTAVIAAVLGTAALGWPPNALVVPIAFIIAGLTRGAAVQVLVLFGAFIALGWGLADIVIVYVMPHTGRMPHALAIPFALAFAMAYPAAKNPKLAALPVLAGLVGLLSVYGGPTPPTNVYGSYNTVTYMTLALAVGWASGVLMWPATSAALFRKRVALQLELCQEAVGAPRKPGEDERRRRIAPLIRGFAEQTAQLARLHAQANLEPIERALDAERRSQILALATDLMDAAVAEQGGALDPLLDRGGDGLQPLRTAMHRENESLLQSMRSAVSMLRGEVGNAGATGLADAHREVARCLDALRADPGALPRLSEEDRRRCLVELASRRRLVFRQLAIDQWIDDWQSAAPAP